MNGAGRERELNNELASIDKSLHRILIRIYEK